MLSRSVLFLLRVVFVRPSSLVFAAPTRCTIVSIECHECFPARFSPIRVILVAIVVTSFLAPRYRGTGTERCITDAVMAMGKWENVPSGCTVLNAPFANCVSTCVCVCRFGIMLAVDDKILN